MVACTSKEKKATLTPFTFPENTELIYHINNRDNFLSALTNNSFWKAHNPRILRLHEVKLLETLPVNDDIWVAFSTEGNCFFICKKENNEKSATWKNASAQVQKQALFGKEWFYTIYGDYLLVGDSEKLSKYTSLNKQNKSDAQQDLEKLQQISGTECVANLFLQKNAANDYFEPFFGEKPLANCKNWVAFDLFLEENNVRLSGVTTIDKEVNTDVMLHTVPYQNDALSLMPARVLSIDAYTFDDAEKLTQNDSIAQESPFRTSINGVAFGRVTEGQFAVVSSFDVDETLQQLPVLSEDFQYNFPMYELNPDLPVGFFTSFVKDFIPRYAGVYQKQLVLTKTKELLISVVNDMQRTRL